MSDTEPRGCLAVVLGLFGINLNGPATNVADFPFRLRDDFLSAAEFSFYRVLFLAVGSQATICPKVNLADIFFVARPNDNSGLRNKINRKHVDFLLCDPATMKPRCGIELDDSSHARRDRQDRDEFVDKVFQAAGLPLVRVPAQSAYNPTVLLSMIAPHLTGHPPARMAPPLVPSPVSATGSPLCPKCGVPMVQRVAKKGATVGQSFYGCPNYPRCKEIA
jgi:hypothetical protein